MKRLLLLSITALLLSASVFAQSSYSILKGDVNNDGSVSVTDVTMVINHILGKTPEGFNKDAADVNGDGSISVTDVTMIINIILTKPEDTAPDYYVGWTNGTKSAFAALSDADIINGATGYSSLTTPTYTRAYGNNNIFYLLYQTSKQPTDIVFRSNNTDQHVNISESNCPHTDVVIDGTTYKVFGMRLTTGYDPNDYITVVFSEPVIATPDYYVGWVTGENSSFANFRGMTADQLLSYATGYNKSSQPSITKTVTAADIVGNRQIFFLMWRDSSAPTGGTFNGGLAEETLTASDFTNGDVFNVQRTDITISSITYHVAGMRLPYETGNYFKINF